MAFRLVCGRRCLRSSAWIDEEGGGLTVIPAIVDTPDLVFVERSDRVADGHSRLFRLQVLVEIRTSLRHA